MRLSWVSLKLASMKTSLSGTTLPSRCPTTMKSPVETRRLENVPSTGARTEVKSRSRSALASDVCNSARFARAATGGEVGGGFGLGQRCLQFGQLRPGLDLLRLGDLDVTHRRVISRS